MPKLISDGTAWRVPITPSADAQVRVLTTENKFLDQNIVVEVAAASAAQGPVLTLTNATNNVAVISPAVDGKFQLTNQLIGKTSYTAAGWIGTGGLAAVLSTNTATVGYITQSTMNLDSTSMSNNGVITPNVSTTQTLNITAGYEGARTVQIAPMSGGTQAAATVTGTAVATKPTIANATQSLTGKTQVTISPTTASTDITNDISPYYISISVTAPATEIPLTKTVTRAGYLGNASQITGSSVTATSSNQVFYASLTPATVSVSVGGTATIPTASSTSATVNNKSKISTTPTTSVSGIDQYYVALEVVAPATTLTNFTKSVNPNGYIANSNQINTSGTLSANTATYYVPIQSATLVASSGTASAASTNVTINTVTTEPASGYYITINGAGRASISREGWISTASTVLSNTGSAYVTLNSATITENINTGTISVSEGYFGSTASRTYNLTRGTISSGTQDKTSLTGTAQYAANNTIVPANGYLYIASGFYPNTQISLDSILGGNADVAPTGVAYILKEYAAYDVDGNYIEGTIDTYDGDYTTS